MASLFEPLALPGAVEEYEEEIKHRWQSKLARDAEFKDVAAGPARLVRELANTIRVPQEAEQGPESSWHDAVVDLVGDEQTIGIIGSQLRYLVAVIEEVVLSNIPDEQHVESVWRLHRAAYFGLESAARAAASEIATVAYYSLITSLRNKNAFKQDIERLVTRSVALKIVYIDMDGLKIINDLDGHQAGDNALKSLGEQLSRELGEDGTVYHLSGDEFCILTEKLDDDYVKDLMSRVNLFEGPKFSYGSACWPDEGVTWEEVENLADERMRENKRERKESGEAPERPQ